MKRKFLVSLMFASLLMGTIAMANPTIIVGAKNFTEQYVLGNMMSLLLRAHGFNVKEDFGLNTMALRNGVTSGQIDLSPDYTGTAWALYFKQKQRIRNSDELFNKVKEMDLKKNDLVWFGKTPTNDTYALAVTRKFAEEHNLKTISQLTNLINKNPHKYLFGVGFEFYQRPDGFFAMAKDYNMNVLRSNVKPMQVGLDYEAMRKGQINVAMVYTTDGKLLKYHLVVLQDNKGFFPIYSISFVGRKLIMNKYPQIKEILRPLSLYLNNNIMQRLNYLVDSTNMDAKTVAKKYLEGLGLIK